MGLIVSDPGRKQPATERQLVALYNSLMQMDIEEADIPEYLMDTYGVALPLTFQDASYLLDLVFQEVNEYWRDMEGNASEIY